MKKHIPFFALGILALSVVTIFCGGCIYTSNVVFPNDGEALYCFLDPQNNHSYLYRIELSSRIPELEAKFDNPVTSIALSEDKKTLFYLEIVEGNAEDKKGTLSLKTLPITEINKPDKAKVICNFRINTDAGVKMGTSFGIGNILPLTAKGIVFVHYIEQENKAVLIKVSIKGAESKTVDEGIVTFTRLSPNGKYLAYVKSEKYKSEKEGKEGFKSKVVVIDSDTLKEVEKKDVGEWEVPPQFAFCPAGKDDFKILYPSNNNELEKPEPKGASVKMHYVSSMQYIAGTNRVFIYGPGEKNSDGALGEICDMNCNMSETIDCKYFLPITWSPDDKFFFLGSNYYLAQYVVAKKIFAVYEFIPPGAEGKKEPEVYSTLLDKLPERDDGDFWKKKEEKGTE
jgi:hypothetical protein